MSRRYNVSLISRSPRRTFLGEPIVSRVSVIASRGEMDINVALTNAIVCGKPDWAKAASRGSALLSRADAKRLGEALLAWAASEPAEWEDE